MSTETKCQIVAVVAVLAAIIYNYSDPAERQDFYREWIESRAARERRETTELERPYRPAAIRPLPAQSRKYLRSLYLENLPVGRWAVVSRRAIWKADSWQTTANWRVFMRARMDKKSADGWSNGGKLVDDPEWNVVVEHTATNTWTVWLRSEQVSYRNPTADRAPVGLEGDWVPATTVSAVELPVPVDSK